MSRPARAPNFAQDGLAVDWENEANLAKLRQLWSEGLPTAEIARRMKTSKNAVVGKAYRIGLPRRPSPIRRREEGYVPEQKAALRVKAGTSTLPQLSMMPAHVMPVRTQPERPRYQVREQPCCWPVGHPGTPDFHFCNAGAVRGKPYCEGHAAIAYVRVKDRRKDSA